MMKRMLGSIVVAAFAIGVAFAAEVGGVKLDDKVAVGGQDLLLNGAGVRTRVVFRVYVASLYLPQKATDLQGVLAKSPRRIQMNMLRGLSAEQLADALMEGLSDTSTAEQLAAIKPQTDELVAIMKAFKEIKERDVVTLDFVDGATRVGWNGELKGTLAGAAFNAALTRIWLGEKPMQADLKRALLGG
jgi:long-chain acyl-CoA synthetase